MQSVFTDASAIVAFQIRLLNGGSGFIFNYFDKFGDIQSG